MSGGSDPGYDDLSPAWLLFYLGLGACTVATLLWGPGTATGAVMLFVPLVCLAFVWTFRAARWVRERVQDIAYDWHTT